MHTSQSTKYRAKKMKKHAVLRGGGCFLTVTSETRGGGIHLIQRTRSVGIRRIIPPIV